MEAYFVFFFLCLLPVGIHSQFQTVTCKPDIVPDLPAKFTTNTVILQSPACCFDGFTCPLVTCEIWLVPAINSGITNFDVDKMDPNVLGLSPYPSAFTNSNAKNYFMTKVGVQSDFPCVSHDGKYFRVGADGFCSTPNCNGVLPQGSTAKFKYVLVDSVNKRVYAQSQWSDDITLKTLKDLNTIDDRYAGRSAAMIVITSILCAAAALLLLVFFIVLCVVCCCRRKNGSKAPPSIAGSFRIPHYDTHSLKNPSPYDNPAYEKEFKYSTADTLPKSSATTAVNPAPQDAIKMQKI